MDLFATKGLEYLLVIGYLALLVSFWRFVTPRKADAAKKLIEVPRNLYFHQGHAWIEPEHGSIVRVGMDSLAEQLVGANATPLLPPVGSDLLEGEPGWQVIIGEDAIPILSPVNGRVVAVNPRPTAHDWLLEVKVHSPAAARRNLLHGRLARVWMRDESDRYLEESLVVRDRTALAREFLN